MNKDTKIFVAGHRGLVGSAILRRLLQHGYTNIVLKTRSELDLTRQSEVEDFFESEAPALVYLAAARVGGILANSTHPAEFIYENLAISTNVIHSAYTHGTKKLINLGSSCIYPRDAVQPITEEALLTGPLEPTNEAYAVAKIAAVKLCRYYRLQYGADFISLMPANLSGPGDNFDPEGSHVLPALMRKFSEAKAQGLSQVEVWGTGKPRREFLHVEDLAGAAVFIAENYSCDQTGEIINVGTGEDVSIAELAGMISTVTGYEGRVVFDPSKPDGTPRKVLDVSRLSRLGWRHAIPLFDGICRTYYWYLENQEVLCSRHGSRCRGLN
jgi:GDP-L-fucose synthase